MNPDFKSYLEQHRQEVMDFLKTLVEINSFSGNPSGVNRVGKMLADFLNPMGVEQTVHERKEIGSHYRFTSPSAQGGAKLLFLVHLDTVFPEDCGFTQFRVDGDKAFGPGVIDMKGGIVVLCFALKMIHDLCLNHPFEYTIMAVSDEEIGSEDSRSLTEAAASGKDYAFCFECGGSNGELVTARKGVGTFVIDIEGKAAHAGNSYALGIDANGELAHKLLAVRGLTNLERGTTVNIGQIKGGIGANTISPSAQMKIDLRFEEPAEGERVFRELTRITQTSFVTGSQSVLSGKIQRPVMVETEDTRQFLTRISEVAGRPIPKERRGGVSDANFTAALGVPTLDGFGPLGRNDHTHNEYLLLDSLFERIELLGRILSAI